MTGGITDGLGFSGLEMFLGSALRAGFFLGAIDAAAGEYFVFVCHLLLVIP